MRIRELVAGGAIVSAAFTAFVTVPPAQAAGFEAAAVTCGNEYWPHSNQDNGHGKVVKSSPAAVHTGPYGACTIVGYVAPGTTVYYDCYSVNDYDSTWTWIRDADGSSLGWIYDAYLDNGGANARC
ncbi:MAG TPA: hypothetical protein VNO31_26975 [Umezawaea sp.]|nr:hypothetical protein [Umezawaea sp.]